MSRSNTDNSSSLFISGSLHLFNSHYSKFVGGGAGRARVAVPTAKAREWSRPNPWMTLTNLYWLQLNKRHLPAAR